MPIKDPGRLAALLDLVAKVATVAPQSTHISSAAMKEIHAANEELRKEGLEEARKLEEEKAKKERDAAILAAAGPARDLLAQEAADKQAREAAAKQVTEADRVAKEEFDRREAERRAADPHGLRPPPPAPVVDNTPRPRTIP